MKDKFIKQSFDEVIKVDKLITIFYLEFSKNFSYEGEKHDFWEMVYIDKGEMICTADTKQFILKGGELTFHKPNEFHNLSSNKKIDPNVSIITFECKSPAMSFFEGKIFKLTSEDIRILSCLFEEGLSAYSLIDKTNPLLQQLIKNDNARFGSSQLTKILLETFLIRLIRNNESFSKKDRQHFTLNGEEIPYEVKSIIDYLQKNIYKKLTIEKIAKDLGKSSSTIKNTFNSYKKNGIIFYFNSLKINEAKRLIKEGNLNFTQISELLDFDTPQYFSTTFKHYTKMSPQQYKNSIIK
jgi:AraC-like DNA-binding protein/mannose-6-phosphate isomerase-like protein (cupin superfamily)